MVIKNKKFEQLAFLYSLNSFFVIRQELFINTYFDISDLKVIEQQSLNLLTKDCDHILKDSKNKFNEMEEMMSTYNVMTNDNTDALLAIVDEEIAQLETIAIDEFIPSSLPATKDDLQQFKRFTYKSFQTIQELIDANHTSGDMQAEMDALKAKAVEDQFEMAKVAVEVFNLFDRVRLTFENRNEEITEQLESVIHHSIQTLKEMGIEEIETYGRDFDGDYMESLGTVSAEEAAGDLKTYQVAIVFRKAFKFIGNNKIIQDALVKTIL